MEIQILDKIINNFIYWGVKHEKETEEKHQAIKEIHKIKVVNISQVARVTKITKRIVESVWKMK